MIDRFSYSRAEEIHASAIKECEPFFNLILSVRNCERPVYHLTDDGLVKVDDGLTGSQRNVIASAQHHIDFIMSRAKEAIIRCGAVNNLDDQPQTR